MNKKDLLLLIGLFSIGILSRIFLVEKMQSHWDGPQYSIAVIRYSLLQETPTIPGYPLYIALGKLFYFFVHDPHKSILAISVLFSGIGAVTFYLLGKTIKNRLVGVTASLLFLTGPTFYYFGLTAYPYSVTPVTASILALVVYRIVIKHKYTNYILGMVYSMCIGVRPQDALFLTPLFLMGIYFLPRREKISNAIVFVLATLCWIIPLSGSVGGVSNYMQLTRDTLKMDSSGFSLWHSISEYFWNMTKGLFLSFTISSLFLIYYLFMFLSNKTNEFKSKKINTSILYFAFWIIPAFIFNLFIRSDHAGHEMTYLSGLLVLIALAIHNTLKHKYRLEIVVVCILVIYNLFTFFRNRDSTFEKPYTPTSFHYSEIQKNDKKLNSKITFIKNNFKPNDTMIVASPDSWRPFMYYLYDFKVYDIDALTQTNRRFADVVRIGYKWDRQQYNIPENRLKIPEGITKIIFTDDESTQWIMDNNKLTYILPANSSISVLKVKSVESLSYHFKFVKRDEI